MFQECIVPGCHDADLVDLDQSTGLCGGCTRTGAPALAEELQRLQAEHEAFLDQLRTALGNHAREDAGPASMRASVRTLRNFYSVVADVLGVSGTDLEARPGVVRDEIVKLREEADVLDRAASKARAEVAALNYRLSEAQRLDEISRSVSVARAEEDGARYRALAARFDAVQPVLRAVAALLGLEAIRPQTAEEGLILAYTLSARASVKAAPEEEDPDSLTEEEWEALIMRSRQ